MESRGLQTGTASRQEQEPSQAGPLPWPSLQRTQPQPTSWLPPMRDAERLRTPDPQTLRGIQNKRIFGVRCLDLGGLCYGGTDNYYDTRKALDRCSRVASVLSMLSLVFSSFPFVPNARSRHLRPLRGPDNEKQWQFRSSLPATPGLGTLVSSFYP